MSNALPATLLAQNPWADVAQHWLDRPQARYVLKEDEPLLKALPKERLHLNLPPQPFIGNPSAPIWILLYHPSYSPVDFLDMVGNASQDKVLGRLPNVDTKENLQSRRRLIFKQLSFDTTCAFYPEDPSFKTMQETSTTRSSGVQNWWRTHLPEKGETLLAKLDVTRASCFVLERFPYHCKKMPPSYASLSKEHSRFWKELVRHAVKTDKVIVSYKKTLQEISEQFGGLPTSKYFYFRGCPNCTATLRNLADFHTDRVLTEYSEEEFTALFQCT